MTLEILKTKKRGLEKELVNTEHQIYLLEKRTADNFPFEIDETYYYLPNEFAVAQFTLDENCFFTERTIQVRESERHTSGYYYEHIYKELKNRCRKL